jgi:hypothetical protein
MIFPQAKEDNMTNDPIRGRREALGEAVLNPFGQGRRPETGQFRLQVDGQTKVSYSTYEAAERAGVAIKQDHPIVQIAVYDAHAGSRKIIELPDV